ncbi:MAG: Stk1 family PASTA domain-containing Ser/Thr kinase [Lachnospiraceae bacterium]|nr:Stk1 family PASTA domain-containing Ser/Thr kinase [Lachnospiraceae bacterium]
MLRKGMFISDRYEIIDKVGSGGMSDVYKAKCHKLNRFVAIKVLKSEFSEDRNFVAKFKVEAQSAAGLSHPNIVNVFDVGEDEGIHYIVMELIEGITLKKYIERKEQLPFKEAVSILIQVAQGIEAAHNNHIIHRDIKPQNIIISKEGKVKVTDFGIARAASTNTISSNAMGSVHYISPEQAKGGFIDEKSDIYSLGITLYEMLTGRVPFEGDSTVSVALQHVQNDMPSPTIYVEDLPISVQKIIEKCTQKKPDRRYLKVSSLIADLKKSLVTPDEDFVQIMVMDDMSTTRKISDTEIQRIRKESGFERPELDIPVIGKDNEVNAVEDDDEIEDDIGDEIEEENPKLDKIIAIGGIVIAVIILIVVAFVIISVAGKGCSSNKPSNNPTTSGTEESTLGEDQTRVPAVAGLTEDEAKAKLKENTLGYLIKELHDDKIAAGYVISASEEEGTIVMKNTTITLNISKGPKEIELKDYANFLKDEAVEELEDLGLIVSVINEESEEIEFGKVIRTEPEKGSSVKNGDEITIYVSSTSEAENVEMPKVKGLTKDRAKANIEGAGLKLGEIKEEYSDDVEKGKIIRADFEEGSSVPTGTTVNLFISLGTNKVEVPDVVGKTKDEAKKALEDVSLKLGEVKEEFNEEVAEGKVISQTVKKGTSVERDSSVSITISKGKEPVIVKKKIVSVTIEKSSLGDLSTYTPDDEGIHIIAKIGEEVIGKAEFERIEVMPNTVIKTFTIPEDMEVEVGDKVTIEIYYNNPESEHSVCLSSKDNYKVKEED